MISQKKGQKIHSKVIDELKKQTKGLNEQEVMEMGLQVSIALARAYIQTLEADKKEAFLNWLIMSVVNSNAVLQ